MSADRPGRARIRRRGRRSRPGTRRPSGLARRHRRLRPTDRPERRHLTSGRRRCWRSSARTAPARARSSSSSPGCSEPRSGDASTVLGGPPGSRPRRVAYLPQAEAVDWEFPVTVGEVVMMGRYARLGVRPRLRAGRPRARRRGPRDGRDGRCRSTARSAPCRAASAGGSSWPGRSPPSRTSTCSTSRSPASMRRPRRT